MKYYYTLTISENKFNVIEASSNYPLSNIETIWEGFELLQVWKFQVEPTNGSFFRAKKWLQNNHPESFI